MLSGKNEEDCPPHAAVCLPVAFTVQCIADSTGSSWWSKFRVFSKHHYWCLWPKNYLISLYWNEKKSWSYLLVETCSEKLKLFVGSFNNIYSETLLPVCWLTLSCMPGYDEPLWRKKEVDCFIYAGQKDRRPNLYRLGGQKID